MLPGTPMFSSLNVTESHWIRTRPPPPPPPPAPPPPMFPLPPVAYILPVPWKSPQDNHTAPPLPPPAFAPWGGENTEVRECAYRLKIQ